MKKIEVEFVINQYRSGIDSYTAFTKEVGLWQSEEYVFKKYLRKTDNILDVGCGTGRTTFPLNRDGYDNIIGIDLTPEMIDEAVKLNAHFGTNIRFEIGDATNLKYPSFNFDAVIFSFNGLMSIPQRARRYLAMREINRVLKVNGIFIFTTHDRAKEEQFLEFWKEEKNRWDTGSQNKSLYDFGDLVTSSKNESREIFIHIPDQGEILEMLEQNNFKLIETFYRNEKFIESEDVKSKSGECRFWIVKKGSSIS